MRSGSGSWPSTLLKGGDKISNKMLSALDKGSEAWYYYIRGKDKRGEN